MKKVLVLALVCLVSLSVPSYALMAVGARSAGMGGCGVAASKDLTSAYYNPAGILKGGNFEARLGAGASLQNVDSMISAFSTVSDPIKFASENYAKEIDANGIVSGIIGVSVSKIGFSLVPTALVLAKKAANSSNCFFGANANITPVMTGGYSLPGILPGTSVDIGGSLKLINDASGSVFTSGTSGNANTAIGSGVGIDLGAITEVEIPSVTKLTVGAVIRDMFETVSYTNKADLYTVSTIDGSAVRTGGGETKSSFTSPTTIGIGAAGTVPVSGTLLTSDMIMVSGTGGETTFRFGAEQPIVGDLLKARAGWSTGTGSAMTIGVGAGLGVNVDLAYVMDSKDSRSNAAVFEVSGGF